MMQGIKDILDALKQLQSTIYLACDEKPADDISKIVRDAVTEITSLRAELEKAKSDDCLIQALTDPENQPSQFGTVPIEWYENLENKLELYRFKVGEVIDSLDGSYEKHAIRKALQEAIEQ